MRQSICEYMESHPKTWEGIANCSNIKEYLDRGMRSPGVSRNHWGTECEILAFADLFNCMIYVFNDGLERKEKQWEGYGPHPCSSRPLGDIGDLTTILVYSANDHFEAVLLHNFFTLY